MLLPDNPASRKERNEKSFLSFPSNGKNAPIKTKTHFNILLQKKKTGEKFWREASAAQRMHQPKVWRSKKNEKSPSIACKAHHPIFTVQLSSSVVIFGQTVILGTCGLSLLLFVYEYNPLIVADRSSEKPIPQRLFTPKSRESRPTFEAIPRGQN